MTSNSNKYKAGRVFYDIKKGKRIKITEVNALYRDKYKSLRLPSHVIVFDSQFEFKTYKELVKLYGSENIFCHYPVDVFPPSVCYPMGKTWKIDFAIWSNGLKSNPFYVEAKGVPTDYFLAMLATLEITNPRVFSNFYLIFDKKISTNRVVNNLVTAQNSKQNNSRHSPRIMLLKDFIKYKQTIRELIK